ncbi:hypothetical protein BH18THE2_BH18THE2_34840 [soil metagenome]
MDLKTKKLVNRNIWIKKGRAGCNKEYEDKDCRHYYGKSLRRELVVFNWLKMH